MEIISSGIITVPAGVSSTGLYFIQEGVLQVVDKGWAQEIGLAEGGQAFVSSGGILYLCTVSSGGTVTVLSGGYAQDVTVENGGLYLVSSGGTAHKSLLKSGGTQIVRAGEMAASVTVMEGGVLHYFHDLDEFMRMMHALLRKGGKMICSDFHPFTKLEDTLGLDTKTMDYFSTEVFEGEMAHARFYDGEIRRQMPKCSYRKYRTQ